MVKLRLCRVLFVLTLLAPGTAFAQAAAFLSVLEDLPLMPGLVEVADAGMVFDGPTGRIVEAFAAGNVPPAAVSAFYAETLPQLGWRATAPGQYRRDEEILKLAVTPAPDGASGAGARFTLRPAPAN